MKIAAEDDLYPKDKQLIHLLSSVFFWAAITDVPTPTNGSDIESSDIGKCRKQMKNKERKSTEVAVRFLEIYLEFRNKIFFSIKVRFT